MADSKARGALVQSVLYVLMLALAVGAFFAIRAAGEREAPAVTAPAASTVAETTNTLLHVLLAIATIITVTRVMGLLFRRIGQPPVIGEVVGGILLGPSLLGRIAPDAMAYLLPPDVAPILGVIAQLGVILFMFLVGLELDLGHLRESGRATLLISHASIALPFVLGAAVALPLYDTMAGDGISFTVFALFFGVSLSVTAFPVLARILMDARVHQTRLGVLALACAALGDATAWCLLAFVVSIAQGRSGDAVYSVVLTLVFVVVLVTVVGPLLRRWLPRIESTPGLSRSSLAVILVAMLLSALATEFIGIHALFGAFLLGAIIPHNSPVAAEIRRRVEDLARVLLLPAFFAFTGLRTEIGLISGLDQWLLCAGIIAVAVAGKFGGTLVAARVTGLSWRGSSALGVLMNTRGLVELIVLNIGLDLGVITPTLFTMLVIMALVTTFMTSPLLLAIMGGDSWDESLKAGA